MNLYDSKSIEDKEAKINKIQRVYYSLESLNLSSETDAMFYNFLDDIFELYNNLLRKLTKTNEKNRYDTIELPLNTVMFQTWKKGITIDGQILKAHLNGLIDEVYNLRNWLQLNHGIFSRTDTKNIIDAFKEKYKDPSFEDLEEIKSFAKIKSDNCELSKIFFEEGKLSKDLAILSRVASIDNQRINPSIETFGSVSSRILVNSPALQQLSKKFRNIIVPDKGMCFVYPDYSQFEAGILANDSKDTQLIEIYNSADIYENLQTFISNHNYDREKCKKMFYYYCYGMKLKKIEEFFGFDLNSYFDKFPAVEVYLKKLKDNYIANKYVQSYLGNRRYGDDNKLNLLEENWVLSHRIQSNSSLIFKTALLEVNKNVSKTKLVLPMHDAALYQVPILEREKKEIEIEKCFKTAFKKYCDLIEPKINFKEFYQNK